MKATFLRVSEGGKIAVSGEVNPNKPLGVNECTADIGHRLSYEKAMQAFNSSFVLEFEVKEVDTVEDGGGCFVAGRKKVAIVSLVEPSKEDKCNVCFDEWPDTCPKCSKIPKEGTGYLKIDCPLCLVPLDLHGTSCGWQNAATKINSTGIIIDDRHPQFGKCFTPSQDGIVQPPFCVIDMERLGEKTEWQTINPNLPKYAMSSNLNTEGMDVNWIDLWCEVENWYGDIQKRETAEQLLTRLQKKFELSKLKG